MYWWHDAHIQTAPSFVFTASSARSQAPDAVLTDELRRWRLRPAISPWPRRPGGDVLPITERDRSSDAPRETISERLNRRLLPEPCMITAGSTSKQYCGSRSETARRDDVLARKTAAALRRPEIPCANGSDELLGPARPYRVRGDVEQALFITEVLKGHGIAPGRGVVHSTPRGLDGRHCDVQATF